jgi:hypothetical protein
MDMSSDVAHSIVVMSSDKVSIYDVTTTCATSDDISMYDITRITGAISDDVSTHGITW